MALSYSPNLILLDILLPDMNGQDLALQLRRLPTLTATPIIAVTALAKADDRQQILLSGCNDYITKPYILEDLEAIIQKHLAIGQPAVHLHGP
jgi:CheY-like chemotaxis protein